MSGGRLSPEERRLLWLCEGIAWGAPTVATLLTVSVMFIADIVGYRDNGALALSVFVINAPLGATAAAVRVARFHPVQRDRWWRARFAFVFGVVFPFVAFHAIGILLGGVGVRL